MTNPSIPPCPVCGEQPIEWDWTVIHDCPKSDAHIGTLGVLSVGTMTVDEWWKCTERDLGRALRTHGIHTLAELDARLAPDPRIEDHKKLKAFCDEFVMRENDPDNADYRTLDKKLADALAEIESLKSAATDPRAVALDKIGFHTVDAMLECMEVKPDPRVAVLEARVKRLLDGIEQHETHKTFVFGVTQHMGKSEPSAADKDLWALKSAESEGSVV